MYDVRVQANETVDFPMQNHHDVYLMAHEGVITVNGKEFKQSETGLLADEKYARPRANTDALVVTFLVNPKAKIKKAATIGR